MSRQWWSRGRNPGTWYPTDIEGWLLGRDKRAARVWAANAEEAAQRYKHILTYLRLIYGDTNV